MLVYSAQMVYVKRTNIKRKKSCLVFKGTQCKRYAVNGMVMQSVTIAMLCRFYGFSIKEVLSMTLRLFAGMLAEIGEVLKIELGDNGDRPTSLTGEAGFQLARRVFPRGRK